jgi:hypothetical protein
MEINFEDSIVLFGKFRIFINIKKAKYKHILNANNAEKSLQLISS